MTFLPRDYLDQLEALHETLSVQLASAIVSQADAKRMGQTDSAICYQHRALALGQALDSLAMVVVALRSTMLPLPHRCIEQH